MLQFSTSKIVNITNTVAVNTSFVMNKTKCFI